MAVRAVSYPRFPCISIQGFKEWETLNQYVRSFGRIFGQCLVDGKSDMLYLYFINPQKVSNKISYIIRPEFYELVQKRM